MNSRPSGIWYSHNKAVHKSILDLCHHQAMFVNLFIFYYASAFFFGAVRFGFEAVSEAATAGAAFLEAVLLNFAFIAFFFLEFP